MIVIAVAPTRPVLNTILSPSPEPVVDLIDNVWLTLVPPSILVIPLSVILALDLLSATPVVPIYVVSARSATVLSTPNVEAALPLNALPTL